MLIVCPNIAFDHTVHLARLSPGQVIRTGPGRTEAGGKGANAARAARALGARPRVAGFAAQDGRTRLHELFGALAGPLLSVDVPGVVRTCTVLLEDDGTVTLLNEPGPLVTADDWARLAELALGALRPGEPLLCCGSLPPGSHPDAYADLVRRGQASGSPVLVDTSGPALESAIVAGADLVCPNLSEAEWLLHGRADEDVAESAPDVPARAASAARALRERGARVAVVTAGGAGVAMAAPDGVWWQGAATVTVRNPIGAGDSFLAGLAVARESGASWPGALRRGVAAAAASVEQVGSGVVDPDRVPEIEGTLAPLAAERPAG